MCFGALQLYLHPSQLFAQLRKLALAFAVEKRNANVGALTAGYARHPWLRPTAAL
jgi:hypothetical protein